MIRAQPAPEEIRGALARASGRLGIIARDIVWYPEVGSTNDVAGALAERGAAEGTIVLAEQQTAGRGRLGRSWVSPPGAGLYLSLVLRPQPRAAVLLTIAAGVAVADGIAAATGLETELKWPNDLHVDRRKLAGVLAEGAAGHVVLGIGINVRQAVLPPEVTSRATSIEAELGREADRGLVLAECLAALAVRYREVSGDGAATVIAAWRRRAAATFGHRIAWDAGGGRTRLGQIEDIDSGGALLVRTGSELVRITSGDVQWV